MPELNHEYYAKRAAAARDMAANASSPQIRTIHERMADDYTKLAKLDERAEISLLAVS